jgi:hypothetical protein
MFEYSIKRLRVLSNEKPFKAWASRAGKINSLNPVSECWPGIGVVVDFLVGAGMMELAHIKIAESGS